jgi:putative iron-dependent peroxidase
VAGAHEPQPGIFAEGTSSHLHLEWAVHDGASNDEVRAALRQALGLAESTLAAGGPNVVVGFGARLWPRLSRAVPAELRDFSAVGTEPRVAPATQRDIWMWLHGSAVDALFDHAHPAANALAPVAELALEQLCFRYRDSRDLTGFIDGTENPPMWEAQSVALVPYGEPGAGGAHALTQRWVHDLDRFHALGVDEQERVIGRTKTDSVELDDAHKPPTAHIARVVVEEDGEELEIFRRSVPFLGIREHGLHFVAFAAEPRRFAVMLARMFGTSGDGLHDRLTDFSRPVTGSFWFVPSLADLAAALATA